MEIQNCLPHEVDQGWKKPSPFAALVSCFLLIFYFALAVVAVACAVLVMFLVLDSIGNVNDVEQSPSSEYTLARIADVAPINGGRGGVIVDHLDHIEEVNRNGDRVVLPHWCTSACLLYLSLGPERVCMPEPRLFASSALWFHMATHARTGAPRGAEYSEALFARYLPDAAMQWAREHDAFSSRMFSPLNHRMSFGEAIELGLVSRCEDWD